MGDVAAFAELANMMDAQERHARLMDLQAATGHMKKHAYRAHVRDLRRLAMGPRNRAADQEITHSGADHGPADLAAFGIQVVHVKAKEAQAGG